MSSRPTDRLGRRSAARGRAGGAPPAPAMPVPPPVSPPAPAPAPTRLPAPKLLDGRAWEVSARTTVCPAVRPERICTLPCPTEPVRTVTWLTDPSRRRPTDPVPVETLVTADTGTVSTLSARVVSMVTDAFAPEARASVAAGTSTTTAYVVALEPVFDAVGSRLIDETVPLTEPPPEGVTVAVCPTATAGRLASGTCRVTVAALGVTRTIPVFAAVWEPATRLTVPTTPEAGAVNVAAASWSLALVSDCSAKVSAAWSRMSLASLDVAAPEPDDAPAADPEDRELAELPPADPDAAPPEAPEPEVPDEEDPPAADEPEPLAAAAAALVSWAASESIVVPAWDWAFETACSAVRQAVTWSAFGAVGAGLVVVLELDDVVLLGLVDVVAVSSGSLFVDVAVGSVADVLDDVAAAGFALTDVANKGAHADAAARSAWSTFALAAFSPFVSIGAPPPPVPALPARVVDAVGADSPLPDELRPADELDVLDGLEELAVPEPLAAALSSLSRVTRAWSTCACASRTACCSDAVSSVASCCPAVTCWPTETSTVATVPDIGQPTVTSPTRAAVPLRLSVCRTAPDETRAVRYCDVCDPPPGNPFAMAVPPTTTSATAPSSPASGNQWRRRGRSRTVRSATRRTSGGAAAPGAEARPVHWRPQRHAGRRDRARLACLPLGGRALADRDIGGTRLDRLGVCRAAARRHRHRGCGRGGAFAGRRDPRQRERGP